MLSLLFLRIHTAQTRIAQLQPHFPAAARYRLHQLFQKMVQRTFLIRRQQNLTVDMFLDQMADTRIFAYPGSLRLLPSCEESLHNATVVPLMLLNFVENTVKYEVVMGKVLDIHIDVTAREKNQCTRLHICIWDTGRGFSEDMLAVLQNLDTYVNSEQEHIGITNVVLRLRQIFPDAAFTFCNRSGAGAQITIDFPYVPFFRIDG